VSPAAGLGRREFLVRAGLGGAGLWLAIRLPSSAQAAAQPPPTALEPSAWLRIDPRGQVTIYLAKAEMGQGVFTSMPMLVAEELEADWKTIQVVQAVADPRYGRMGTGGSSSVRGSFLPLRQAGAAARELLVEAAARRWKVDRSTCRAQQGQVIHGPTGRTLGYGALALAAAALPVPADPPLKDPKDFRLIGRPVARLEGPAKVSGRAVFGIDVRVPGLRHAVVARPPVMGGKVAGFDRARALAVPGVRQVLEVPSGVAVVADTTWAAIQGREALGVRFDAGPNGQLDQAAIAAALATAPVVSPPVRAEGDLGAALAAAAQRLTATYELPLLAHATMEPMNCTAHVKGKALEVWAPTQAPAFALPALEQAMGFPANRVTLHTTFLGGGFGRRALPDFVVEAAQVSKAAGGPVQVTWTREDDLRHDFYRPPGRNELAAGLDARGRLVAWHHRVRSPSILQQRFGSSDRGGHPDVVEGAADVPYQAGAVLVDCALPVLGLPIGWWRSVYSSQNAFPEECFLDEVAAAAGRDPLQFRLDHLPTGHRLRGALALAAERAGWGKPLPAGRARGVACHASFGSHVAEVVEASVEGGRVRVHRVTCAIDCGQVINPNTVEAQVEGAVVYGLSAALRGEITVKDGAVVESNFDGYEPLRMDEMPAVEVHVVPSTEPPGGLGEPGLPPLAPALANALFALTGRRLRRLPLRDLGSG
jgi:isoquinoline 1-oxidoreductase beta subunit